MGRADLERSRKELRCNVIPYSAGGEVQQEDEPAGSWTWTWTD